MFWEHVRWFSKSENWGDPSRVDPLLVLTLDKIRDIYGRPFIIHCAYETSGHSPRSYHYVGRAVDFHVKDDRPFRLQVEKLLQILNEITVKVESYNSDSTKVLSPLSDYVGLGIYPDWNNPGFHLDLRGYKARWARISGTYVSFEEGLKHIDLKEKR